MFVWDNLFLWKFVMRIFLRVKLIVVENRLSNISEEMKIVLLLVLVSNRVRLILV